MRHRYLLILLTAYVVSIPVVIYFWHQQTVLLAFIMSVFLLISIYNWRMLGGVVASSLLSGVIGICHWLFPEFENNLLLHIFLAANAIMTIMFVLRIVIHDLFFEKGDYWGQTIKQTNDIKEKFSILTQATNDAIIIVNHQGKIAYWNEAAHQMFGYDSEEILSMPWSILISQSQYYDIFLAGLDKFKEIDDNSGMIEVIEAFGLDKSGNEIPVELTVSTIKIEKHWHAVAVVRNISERIRAKENIYKLAHFDSLTNLPNRISFNQTVGQRIYDYAKGKIGFAIMLMDLNQFKTVNDSLGHEIGDLLLVGVAKRLQNCFTEEDVTFRFAGDEFALIFQETKRESLEYYADLLLAQFCEPFDVKGTMIFSSISVGVSIFPEDASDLMELVRNADTAMNYAKEYGHSKFQFYTPEMHRQETEKLAMHNDLQMALQRQEFILYYQPQVDLQSGDVVGMEALVRWQHPQLGMVSPVKFIPISEETGTIVEIGKWVLREACRQYKVWEKCGYKQIPIAVNISMKEFQNPCFIERLASTLQEYDMDANFLELEITESVAMFDVEYVIRILQELKAMGIKVAIDDFGTGFSSLNVLKTLPIDKLKIDRSFIKDITAQQNDTDSAILETFITLAKKLRLTVVAEGVETEEQKNFLSHHQCDLMQGYLVSPPVSAEQAQNFLNRQ